MQNVIINVNGQIFRSADWQNAKISVMDRSFMYGDSLYEVARSYNGKLFKVEEHLTRLKASAALCRMTLNQPLDEYAKQMQRTVEEFHAQPGNAGIEVYCRIIVSRGTGKIGFGLSNLLTPSQYVIIVQPLDPPGPELFKKGYRYQVVTRLRNDPRALDPAMKSGNYLNSLLAFLEATEAGFDDALMCNVDGFVTEGTTFNIFYVRRGIIATPPLDIGILDGITRKIVIKQARQLGLEVREVRFPKERLYEADEVFMTSTIKEAFPVTQVDDHVISGGKPGPITARLNQVFHGAASATR